MATTVVGTLGRTRFCSDLKRLASCCQTVWFGASILISELGLLTCEVGTVECVGMDLKPY